MTRNSCVGMGVHRPHHLMWGCSSATSCCVRCAASHLHFAGDWLESPSLFSLLGSWTLIFFFLFFLFLPDFFFVTSASTCRVIYHSRPLQSETFGGREGGGANDTRVGLNISKECSLFVFFVSLSSSSFGRKTGK